MYYSFITTLHHTLSGRPAQTCCSTSGRTKHSDEATSWKDSHQLVVGFLLHGTLKEAHSTWDVSCLHPFNSFRQRVRVR